MFFPSLFIPSLFPPFPSPLFSLSFTPFPLLCPCTLFPLLLSLSSFPLLPSLYSFLHSFPSPLSFYSFPFTLFPFLSLSLSFILFPFLLSIVHFFGSQLIRMSSKKNWSPIHSYVFQFIRISSIFKWWVCGTVWWCVGICGFRFNREFFWQSCGILVGNTKLDMPQSCAAWRYLPSWTVATTKGWLCRGKLGLEKPWNKDYIQRHYNII